MTQRILRNVVHVAQTANATLTMLYWHVGHRLHEEVLKDGRAEYGEQILPTLSAKLVRDYGQGFSARNLAHIPDVKVLQAQLHRAVELARERTAGPALPPPDARNTPRPKPGRKKGRVDDNE
ncbi:DUF1016 N-terminal domain-containing protein [Gemmatimonas aurantiaca]|uniref:DUF1016 N-terminal domain-containing protein n=1 Tax=Gemmatimonas aurantiaca TaxID=173480 RepID=UPI00301E5CB3